MLQCGSEPMTKTWKVLPRKSDNIIEQILVNRGIKSKKDQELFFNPKIENFADDVDIENIDIAKKRIIKAIKNEELIFVNGDYDVDGICGAAVLYLGLTAIGAKVLPYLPHREKEGYGISKTGLDEAKQKGAKLVISVDCGIVDFTASDYAKSLGLDLIITDHHQPLKDSRPNALTIVHSIKMCGTAVAWCLVKSLVGKEIAEDLLDLVAIATIADMMPMLGINRAFVKTGLLKLNSTKKVGLKALISEAGLNLGDVGFYEIGHMIAPRLNALGRVDSAMDALRLMCTKSPKKAVDLAQVLGQANTNRQKLTFDAVESAKLMVTKQTTKVHIMADKSWHPGIIGLVAGRITEETRKPSIAIALGEEHSKGSARSVDGINIVEVIRRCSDLLVAVGGHPGAAGFTIYTNKIAEFKTRIEEIIEKEDVEGAVLEIDEEVPSNNLTLNLAKEIEKFEPFGIKNPKPIFATLNVRLSDINTVGSGKHLKGKADGIDFIAFNKGDMLDLLQDGLLVDLAYHLEINRFNGSQKLQLLIKDLRLA